MSDYMCLWPKRGGGHSGNEWIPTDKRPHRAEEVNAHRTVKSFLGK